MINKTEKPKRETKQRERKERRNNSKIQTEKKTAKDGKEETGGRWELRLRERVQ